MIGVLQLQSFFITGCWWHYLFWRLRFKAFLIKNFMSIGLFKVLLKFKLEIIKIEWTWNGDCFIDSLLILLKFLKVCIKMSFLFENIWSIALRLTAKYSINPKFKLKWPSVDFFHISCNICLITWSGIVVWFFEYLQQFSINCSPAYDCNEYSSRTL